MEFFCDLISKVKSNYFLLLICLLFIVLNDAIIISDLYTLKSKHDISTINNLKDNEENIDEFKVDIKGEVKKPGVYIVNSSMNVNDVINLAGGLKKGATTNNINLSKKLKNEMVIIVSKKNKNIVINDKENTLISNDAKITSSDVVGEIKNDNITESSNLISISTASIEELQMLNGIGKAKAEAIIKYRNENTFSRIEDILNVPGIGQSLFEKFKDQICL